MSNPPSPGQLFPDNNGLYFLPLGGSNEIGMNLNLYRYQGKWLLVDLGIGFADEYLPGVEVVVPDIRFLDGIREDIVGLVLTHAHEDHIGAVPYLWPQLRCPIYATPFTTRVLESKIQQMRASFRLPITEVNTGSHFSVGPFVLEMIELTHSIPEMNAIALRTDAGTVLHTGDWKFDANPLLGPASNHRALEALGQEGVLALICDSTNVFVEGESGSEAEVRVGLTEQVAQCQGRVIVTTFASNVARLESIVHAATANGRKVAVSGRAMHRMLTAAKDSGYLTEMAELLSEEQAMALPRDKVLLLITGSQGESRAGLWRVAAREHPVLRLSPGDTVLFSSREIPGNEKRIGIVQNRLIQSGVRVVTSRDAMIHVSGHPARDELTRMYQMVKPQIAVPVHGEQRHMHAHATLAEELHVPHTVVGANGSVIRLDIPEPKVVGQVPSGYVAIDGASLLPADGFVMRMRRRMRDEGIVFASVLVSERGEVEDVQIAAPGLLDAKEDADWLAALREDVADAVEAKGKKAAVDAQQDAVRHTIRRLFQQEFMKKPMVQAHIHRV